MLALWWPRATGCAGGALTWQHVVDAADDPIALSALQHWAYCPRQCALIHIEQAFDENLQTQHGRAQHAQVDRPGVDVRHGVRVERALPLWSDELGLIGKADVVEFEPDGTPYPVEYKHGSRHKAAAIAACDDLQLAAQALCLEEMIGRAVPEGALFYASSKRRRTLSITPSLRDEVRSAAAAVRQALAKGKMPPPTTDTRRCQGCSLRERCQPEALARLRDGNAASSLFNPDA
jgi:CRISPR-associated exonuclease Cas4